MVLPLNPVDATGNTIQCDAVALSYDVMTNSKVSAKPTITCGTGVPSFATIRGSLYLCLNGSSTSTRVFVATDNVGGWTPLTSAT